MRLLLSVIFMFGAVMLSAQQQMSAVEVQQTIESLGAPPSPTSNNVVQTFDYRFEGVKGTPFIPEDWTEATLITEGDKKLENVKLLYDVLNYELWLQRSNGVRLIINNHQVKSFILNTPGIERKFVRYKDPSGKEAVIFLEVLVEGRVNLYCKHRKYYVPADRENAAYNHQRYEEYRAGKSSYFLQRKGETQMEKITPKKGKMLKALGDHKEEFKAYIKQNNYFVIDESAMIDLVKYYNQLEPVRP